MRPTIVLAALVVLLLAPIGYIAWLMTGEGELAEKPLWAELQGLESDDRNNARSGPILLRRFGRYDYAVLGIPGAGHADGSPGSAGDPTRAWLVLNEHSPSRTIRQIVTFPRYNLPCGSVDRVRAAVPDMDDYVLAHLRRICQPVHVQ